MNPLALLKLVPAKAWVALALVIATVAALGYTYHLGGEAPRAALQARVDAEAKQRMHEVQNKERTDDEAKRRKSANDRLIAGLRERALDLGQRPADSKCPLDQLCLVRADFERAYRELAGELRDEGARCTAIETDLDLAKEWARGD